MIYDIFYVSKSKINDSDWSKFRQRFPISQKIENVENFEDIRSKAFTKFFYVVWNGTEVLNFNFDYEVSEWDEEYIHVWKTLRNGEETYQGGIALFPKNVNLVSSREFVNRYYINKKEMNDVTSKQIYPRYTIKTYEEYLRIIETADQPLFWNVPDDIVIINQDIFDLYFDPNDGKYDYDRNENHVFKNRNYYDGVSLLSKNKILSEKEFNFRFFASKKEWDILVSEPKPFEKHYINSYDDYLKILENCKTNMFWVIWPDIDTITDLEYQVPYYDQHIIHVFLNDKWFDGVALFSTKEPISKKEFTHRFYKNRKEILIQLSSPKPYDIFFISYNESNADENYKKLISRFPRAKRINGITGIHNAHMEAAKMSETQKFWVVDADAVIVEDFNFEIDYYPHYDPGNRKEHISTVYVWQSQNPINDLVYGYGGVKLLPKFLTENMEIDTVDMTTSISDRLKVVSQISNITAFNTDPFSSWKSAFRECVKLSSKVIDDNYDAETDVRLGIWCTVGEDRPYGKYAIGGATEGRMYGYESIGNLQALMKINDFSWLEEKFQKWLKENEQ